jgi:hypothetical protein
MLLVPLESPHWVGLHQVGFIMLQRMVEILNQKKIHWRFVLNQNKTFRGEFGCALGTVGQHLTRGFNKGGLKKFRPDILNFEYISLEIQLNYKMILNGKISWVSNSHMGQWHRLGHLFGNVPTLKLYSTHNWASTNIMSSIVSLCRKEGRSWMRKLILHQWDYQSD